MADSGDITFRERWWEQVRSDRQVVGDLLAAALLISTTANRDGTRALLSNRQLAEDLGVSLATAERRTRQLRELGYMQVVERGHRRGDGTVSANIYDLSQPLSQVRDRESQHVTQVRDRDGSQPLSQVRDGEFSTPQTGASTPQTGASTPRLGEGPLLYPPLSPPRAGARERGARAASPRPLRGVQPPRKDLPGRQRQSAKPRVQPTRSGRQRDQRRNLPRIRSLRGLRRPARRARPNRQMWAPTSARASELMSGALFPGSKICSACGEPYSRPGLISRCASRHQQAVEPLAFDNYAGQLATFSVDGGAVRIDVRRGHAYISTLEARTLARWLLAAVGDPEHPDREETSA